MESISPTVVGLQSVVAHQSTALVLSFSEPMDAARAEDPANYHLVWAGKDQRLGTGDDQAIPIRGARYDAASQSVKLRLVHRQPLNRTLWLTIADASPGGLTNAWGTPLSGVGTGGPGSDHAIGLDLKALRRPMRMGLLPDGGFETPTIHLPKKARTFSAGDPALSPWRIAAGSVDVQSYWPVAEGRHTLDLNGVSAGTLEQSFATVPGQVYQLLFDYGNNPDARARSAGAKVTVSGVGTLLSQDIAHAGSTPRDMKYTRFFGTFLADSATTMLQFASTTPGAYGIVLDAVSVTAVPGASDATPPVIQLTTSAPAGPVSQNVTFAGRATDDGAGVARLEAQVDSGPFQEVALDSLGRFTFTTDLASDGSADGEHVVRFRATDRAGNVSPPTTQSFNLISDSIITGPIVNPENGHSYYLLSQSNWTDAEAEAISLGGHLTTIRNAAENQWVLDTFGHYGGESRFLWLGLHYIGADWHWANGEATVYSNWQPGEGFQGGQGEPYTVMYPDTAFLLGNVLTQGYWDDWADFPYWAATSGPPMFGVAEVAAPTAPGMADTTSP